MKKFFKYFCIVFLMLFGLCAIAVAYLFFVPNSSIFGINYINVNQKYYSKTYNKSIVDSINITSTKYEVKIVDATGDNINVLVVSQNYGFALVKNSTTSIEESLTDGTLDIKINEPHGLISTSSCYIEIFIPKDRIFNLSLTNEKATTTLNAPKASINNLSYTTNKGDFAVEGCKLLGKIYADLNSADMKISPDVEESTNEVELKVKTSKITLTGLVLGDITVSQNERAIFLIGDCNKFTMHTGENGGRVEANLIANVDIESSDVNVYIKTITAGTIKLSKSGSIDVDKATDTINLKTSEGHINVKQALSRLNLESYSGKIYVEKATLAVNSNNQKGNTEIYFDSTASDYSTLTNSRYLYAKSTSGSIVANGTDRVTIENDKGSVYITMHKILGESTVNTNSGSVYVNFAYGTVFNLTTEATNGAVAVDQADELTYNDSQLKTVGIHGGSTTNTMTLKTTTGKLEVKEAENT